MPLAIRHREEVLHEHLYDVELKAGDIILAEVKRHFMSELNNDEQERNADFILLSEDEVPDFRKKRFLVTLGIVLTVIVLASTNVLDIMTGAIAATSLLVLIGFRR